MAAQRRRAEPTAPPGEERTAQPAAERKLGRYRAKRDFAATPEPPADSAGGRGQAPRFVIHEHSARRLHWDLRLEHDGVLASWALPKGLPDSPGENRFAAHTEDHPLEYLSFKGEIPAGQYGAGTMSIWDEGTYECLKWEPRKVEVLLHGERVNGRYALFSLQRGEEKDWMVHRMDPPADPGREPMPRGVVPMLARTGELPAEDEEWAFEIKWDGVRAIAYCEPGELRLQSRNLIEITDRYPDLARLGRTLGAHSAVLDGEIVAFDERGRPSFARLQQRMQVSGASQARRMAKAVPVTYMVFDLLWLDGHSLMQLPYADRRELLAALDLNGERWRTPEHVLGDGRALLAASVEQGLEGILAKRLDSPYEPGVRSRGWVKVKTVARQEFVVGGWFPGKGRRAQRIGALLIGVYEPDGRLRYVGRVGSGLTEGELDRLAALLGPLRRETSPFQAGDSPPRGSRFCEPELVVEVAFSEWTTGGNVRQPTYKGLREDKGAREAVREEPTAEREAPAVAPAQEGLVLPKPGVEGARVQVGGRELKLSNLEKVLYPRSGFTKRQVIEYYAAIAPTLLAHLHGRPLTVKRWPDGVEGEHFFQKQSPAHRPSWVRTATVSAESKPIDYTLAEDLPTLVWLANLAAIELHTPLALADEFERPTTMVFDLDPGAPAGMLECARVGLLLQGMFENLGLQSFAKTSGSKGLQVYVPLNRPDTSYEQTKSFARTVAQLLESAEPELVVSRMTKAKRPGKVLIDWSQNDRNKTTVCAYSLRATERPTVSTPVQWEEVRAALDGQEVGALSFEADEALARVGEQGDLFAPVLSLAQALPAF